MYIQKFNRNKLVKSSQNYRLLCLYIVRKARQAVKVRNDNYKFIEIYLLKKKRKKKMGRKYRGKFVRRTLRFQEIPRLKIYLPSILELGSLRVYDKLEKMYFS